MLFAADRMLATKGMRSSCPICQKPVLAKCGDIVRHHWAHEADGECDPWAEREQEVSQWHRDWQERVPESLREVVIGPHRADIVTAGRYRKIVELQHSNLSPDEIRERERFYRYPEDAHGMWWVFDAISAYNNDRLDISGKTVVKFRWKRPRTSVVSCQRPVFLDIGVALLNILRLDSDEQPYTGIAQVFSHQALLNRIASEMAHDCAVFDDTLSCNERGRRMHQSADREIEWAYLEANGESI